MLFAHGASAPSPIDSAGLGTTSSGSISICEPSPVQRSHAPWGELNEKIRGSSSASDGPCSGQANRSENVNTVARLGRHAGDDLRRPPPARPWRRSRAHARSAASSSPADAPAEPGRAEPMISISTSPSASETAVSIESASRLRTSWRMISRSTTTEMSCL